MSVRLAKRCGFCFGVKRAVEMADTALKKSRPIYSLGQIIHNEDVVRRLADKGLKVVKSIDNIDKGVLVISSHGTSPKLEARISDKGIKIIDTTCPFVRSAQEIAKRLTREGYIVVIVGDANHPEVKALVDFADGKAFVVGDAASAKKLRIARGRRVAVISQTTQSTANFLETVRAIAKTKPLDLEVFNTICKDAESRQEEAKRLAKGVDLMLVVGGMNSANTKRLFEVCSKICGEVHLVESAKGLKPGWFRGVRKVGITSGASTPDWIVEGVVDKVREIQKE